LGTEYELFTYVNDFKGTDVTDVKAVVINVVLIKAIMLPIDLSYIIK
jgi:hypothetical protein